MQKTVFWREWRGGREAEGNGLLNRHTGDFPYRGFESLPLRILVLSFLSKSPLGFVPEGDFLVSELLLL